MIIPLPDFDSALCDCRKILSPSRPVRPLIFQGTDGQAVTETDVPRGSIYLKWNFRLDSHPVILDH